MPNLSQPLTDSELERLEDFLHDMNPEEAMSLEEMDGFLCSLICSPELVPVSEYLPHLWGGEHNEFSFKSRGEAQEFLNLVMNPRRTRIRDWRAKARARKRSSATERNSSHFVNSAFSEACFFFALVCSHLLFAAFQLLPSSL